MKQTLIVCLGLLVAIGNHKFTHAQNTSRYYSDQAEMIIPFRLIKKMIVIQAYVDGKKGNFIIDTGTKKMVVNERNKAGFPVQNLKVSDSGGQAISFRQNMVTFGWSKMEGINYQARILSLSNLEVLMGIPIMGYIGYDILKSYEILFDYEQRKIHLFKLDKKGEWLDKTYLQDKKRYGISLYDNDFLPYLKIGFGDQVLKFGIDSGASLHLLRKASQKKIQSYFHMLPPRVMAGFSGRKRTSTAGIIENMKLEDLSFLPMHCVVESMNELNSTLPNRLDGLLGFEFLNQYKMSINYREGKLYVWETDGF